jgi:hypothetical protein
VTRFFFVETSQRPTALEVPDVPEPANAEPEPLAAEEPAKHALPYERRMEVRDKNGSSRALLKLRSKLDPRRL